MGKKIFLFFSILIIIFLFSCERLQDATEGTLIFIVKDSVTEEPIIGAQIKITQNGQLKVTASTDENGQYKFIGNEGEYNYEVSKLNYLPKTGSTKVYANEERKINILLDKAENNPPTFLNYVSPVDNEIVKEKDVIFRWSANDIEKDTIFYNIYLKYVGNEFFKLNSSPITQNTYTYEPEIKGQYQWKIELWDEPNIDHKIMVLEAPRFYYDPTYDSTINHKPTISLIYPINTIIDKSLVTLSWEASDIDKDH
ncbi:carboxypeptidase-like regulatory domain-containing protein [Marinitoga litoralis]|uniref:carboxypeptidase-like regulatory domain-containing protein n=1 Tax=Marinitoga litoralis TaxID=570855 RepID=UPI0019602173|nr:carboxypeptidase-like regulatory domain-containing protein [Marinitoga litoralis]MBM7559548.1 hypothetical protein [Marinitoga litoralis]